MAQKQTGRMPPVDPHNVTATVAARLMGVSPQTIARMVGDGRLSKKSNGKFDLETVFTQYIAYLTGSADAKIPGSRAALLQQQERKLKLENDQREGKLILLTDASSLFAEWCHRIKIGITAIPGRVASELAPKKKPAAVRKVLNDEINTVLRYATKAFGELPEVGTEGKGNSSNGNGNSETTPRKNTRSVGRQGKGTAKRQRGTRSVAQ